MPDPAGQHDSPPAEQDADRDEQGRWLERPPGAAPVFRPGQSGNPRGRPPNAGRSIIERMNDFADRDMTEPQLRAIADDPDAPLVDRTAATRLIRPLLEDEDQARRAFQTVANYTDGKPIERYRDETPEAEYDAPTLLALIRARFPRPGATTLDRLIEQDDEAARAGDGGLATTKRLATSKRSADGSADGGVGLESRGCTPLTHKLGSSVPPTREPASTDVVDAIESAALSMQADGIPDAKIAGYLGVDVCWLAALREG